MPSSAGQNPPPTKRARVGFLAAPTAAAAVAAAAVVVPPPNTHLRRTCTVLWSCAIQPTLLATKSRPAGRCRRKLGLQHPASCIQVLAGHTKPSAPCTANGTGTGACQEAVSDPALASGTTSHSPMQSSAVQCLPPNAGRPAVSLLWALSAGGRMCGRRSGGGGAYAPKKTLGAPGPRGFRAAAESKLGVSRAVPRHTQATQPACACQSTGGTASQDTSDGFLARATRPPCTTATAAEEPHFTSLLQSGCTS
jgi:hypothetical protein